MHSIDFKTNNPGNMYLFKGNKRNTIKRCEICSKLTTKTPSKNTSLTSLMENWSVFPVMSSDFQKTNQNKSNIFKDSFEKKKCVSEP